MNSVTFWNSMCERGDNFLLRFSFSAFLNNLLSKEMSFHFITLVSCCITWQNIYSTVRILTQSFGLISQQKRKQHKKIVYLDFYIFYSKYKKVQNYKSLINGVSCFIDFLFKQRNYVDKEKNFFFNEASFIRL